MSFGSQDPLQPDRPSPPDRPHAEPITPILIDRPGGERFFPSPPPPRPPKRRRALVLFLLTCLSTIFGWCAYHASGTPVLDQQTGRMVLLLDLSTTLRNGLTYSLGVMTILVFHEMGHYLQARRYGVPASLPYFIPFPISPIGTMGAVIVQQPGVADRKSMFDIAISGPLAGLLIALPLNWWGVSESRIIEGNPNEPGWTNPVIVDWMISLIHRPLGPGEDIQLTPLVFAGWVGIFITGLNLIPIGQLDGGHILYCLIGRRAHTVARGLFATAVVVVVWGVLHGNYEYAGWSLMLALVALMGTRHPPTSDDRVPLGLFRVVLGWLTLAFILVGFIPSPTYQIKETVPQAPPVRQAPALGIEV